MKNQIDLYSDSYIINYKEGDQSLQRREIIHEEDIEDKFYIVKDGDTLTGISHRFYNEPLYWYVIADVNKITNPLNLDSGDQLIIPNLDKYEVL